jgi:ribosome-associated protein
MTTVAPTDKVESMPDNLVINPRLKIPTSEFTWTFVRSSGPGGQNVNKVNSKAVLRWPLAASTSLPADVRDRFLARYGRRVTADGELLVSSQRYRDQGRNVADCLEKLRDLLSTVATPPKRRRPTRPKAGDIQRRLDAKKQSAAKKKGRQPPQWE